MKLAGSAEFNNRNAEQARGLPGVRNKKWETDGRMLNLWRLKYREKIFLGLTAEIRMCNFFSRNCRRKTPVGRFLRVERNIVFLSGIDRLLLILVVPELFF